MRNKLQQHIYWQLFQIQTDPKVAPADSLHPPPTTLRRGARRGGEGRGGFHLARLESPFVKQTQSVSLRLIPPAALSFALTSTIGAFISRPPLVLQRLSPRTQLSHQPSKSSPPPTSSASTSTNSCPLCCLSCSSSPPDATASPVHRGSANPEVLISAGCSDSSKGKMERAKIMYGLVLK